MRERRKGRLGIWVVLLAGMLSAAGCASTPEDRKAREYRQQQAGKQLCHRN